ncbi:MAG TPA: hypothetical protein VMW53_07925 [archaeon]|nr:hypothetical protein [archaeon]
MRINKSLFIIIALFGIGLFVLPSTLSMFAGQHAWYNPNPNIEGIPCEKCHVLEQSELMGTNGPHSLTYASLVNTSANYSGTPGANGSTVFWGSETDITTRCFGCHQVGANFSAGSDYASYNTNWDTNRNISHAAIVIECIDCHPWVAHELENSDEAHRPFYVSLNETTAVNGTSLLKGANEACIACHTHVGVNISWQRASYLSFNATVNTSTGLFNITYNTSDTNVINTSSTTNYSY